MIHHILPLYDDFPAVPSCHAIQHTVRIEANRPLHELQERDIGLGIPDAHGTPQGEPLFFHRASEYDRFVQDGLRVQPLAGKLLCSFVKLKQHSIYLMESHLFSERTDDVFRRVRYGEKEVSLPAKLAHEVARVPIDPVAVDTDDMAHDAQKIPLADLLEMPVTCSDDREDVFIVAVLP